MVAPNFSIILELKAPPPRPKKNQNRRYTISVSYLSFKIIRHRVFSLDLLEPGN